MVMIFEPIFESEILQKRLVNVSFDLFWNECSAVHLMPIEIHHKSERSGGSAEFVEHQFW